MSNFVYTAEGEECLWVSLLATRVADCMKDIANNGGENNELKFNEAHRCVEGMHKSLTMLRDAMYTSKEDK